MCNFLCNCALDKSMQLNQAKFRINGNCGYILRPEFTFTNDFDPSKRSKVFGVDPIILHVRILAARHLTRPGRSSVSPFVEVELIGADFDSGIKLTTKPVGMLPLYIFHMASFWNLPLPWIYTLLVFDLEQQIMV